MVVIENIKNKSNKEFKLVKLSNNDAELINKLYDWCKGTDECSHFPQLWTRFKNWDNSNAYVYILLDTNDVISGINAFTCNIRNPYVNCYYFEVDRCNRKQGLGNKLFFSCIEKGISLGNKRFTLRTKYNSIGLDYYIYIGMIPRFLDPKSKEFIFDFNLEPVKIFNDIKYLSNYINDYPHKSRIRIYKKYENCNN